jgi:saposin
LQRQDRFFTNQHSRKDLRRRRRLRFVNCSQKEAMDFKVASFLLLLLIVTCGAAQGQGNDFVVLDLKTTEIGEDASPMYKEQIASTKIPVTLLRSKHSSLCSACENITSEAVNFLSEKQIQDKIRTILHDTCSQTFSFEQKVIVSF